MRFQFIDIEKRVYPIVLIREGWSYLAVVLDAFHVTESFFGSLKTERVYIIKYTTREEARRDVVDYIEMFYKSKRRHSYLGYLSAMEFEKIGYLKKSA